MGSRRAVAAAWAGPVAVGAARLPAVGPAEDVDNGDDDDDDGLLPPERRQSTQSTASNMAVESKYLVRMESTISPAGRAFNRIVAPVSNRCLRVLQANPPPVGNRCHMGILFHRLIRHVP